MKDEEINKAVKEGTLRIGVQFSSAHETGDAWEQDLIQGFQTHEDATAFVKNKTAEYGRSYFKSICNNDLQDYLKNNGYYSGELVFQMLDAETNEWQEWSQFDSDGNEVYESYREEYSVSEFVKE